MFQLCFFFHINLFQPVIGDMHIHVIDTDWSILDVIRIALHAND